MNDITLKFLIVEVGGEAVLKYPFPNAGDNVAMMEAVIASNPVLRIVDNAEIGDIWDGQNFVSPVE